MYLDECKIKTVITTSLGIQVEMVVSRLTRINGIEDVFGQVPGVGASLLGFSIRLLFIHSLHVSLPNTTVSEARNKEA